jgi:hypothetical protein
MALTYEANPGNPDLMLGHESCVILKVGLKIRYSRLQKNYEKGLYTFVSGGRGFLAGR